MTWLGLGINFGSLAAGAGGPPTITSSDGEPASLTDNGDGTYDVIIDGNNVGTITQAQINAGGWITVVSPEAGMSGDDVVLTTTGYVIYVGNVSIETDVEVLADGAVVGTALPFDATAYPDVRIDVRWSFTVGFGDDLVIESLARAQVLKRVQFRDTWFGVAVGSGNCWPLGQQTRQMTLALRVQGNFRSTAPNANVILNSGVSLQSVVAGGRVRSQSPSPFNNFGTDGTWAPGADQTVSIFAAVDYDGGLPGGEKFVVWWSLNGAAWTRLVGHTSGPVDARNVWSQIVGNGSPSGTVAGGEFDIHNHLWAANVALDPATNWPDFFNADGSVKELPSDGVVNGTSPVLFFVGDDFVTGVNRGVGGGTALRARTPATVVNL